MTLNIQSAGLKKSPILPPNQQDLQPIQENLGLSKMESEEDLEAERHDKYLICFAAKKKRWDLIEGFFKAGISSNTCDVDGKTPLYYAVQVEDAAAVELLLKYDADPDHSIDGLPLLSIAVKNGNPEIIEILLAALLRKNPNYLAGASSNTRDVNGKTPLYYALQAEDAAAVKLLLKYGADPDHSIDGLPLLSMAISNKNPEIVEILLVALLRKNSNYLNVISIGIPKIFSDLQNFAIEKNSQNIIEILLQHRIRLEQLVDLAIEKARPEAVEKACPAAVELLLKKLLEKNKVYFDSLLNQEDFEENFASLLCFAIENNSLELMKFLVNNVTTPDQVRAVIASLEIAIKKINHVMLEGLVVALLRKKEDYFKLIPTQENSGKELVSLFRFLWTKEYSEKNVISPVRSFAWIKDFPEKKLIALLCFVSATNNSLNLINLLVTHGANPYKEAFGITALGIAMATNNPEIVETLITASMQKNKGDFDLLLALEEFNKKPASLLHFAIKTNSLNLINILVGHGVNPDEQYKGVSPLDRVIGNDDVEKVEILVNTLIERNKKENKNYFDRSVIGGGLDKIRQAVKGKKYKVAQKMRHMAAAQLFPRGLVWFGKMYVWFLTNSIFNFGAKPSAKSLKA